MISNLLGSADDSEKLSFIDWNKIGDSRGKELLNFLDEASILGSKFLWVLCLQNRQSPIFKNHDDY